MYNVKQVQLVNELSDLHLQKGQIGIVRNTWPEPMVAYEVEFQSAGQMVRVLLMDHQVIWLNFDVVPAA